MKKDINLIPGKGNTKKNTIIIIGVLVIVIFIIIFTGFIFPLNEKNHMVFYLGEIGNRLVAYKDVEDQYRILQSQREKLKQSQKIIESINQNNIKPTELIISIEKSLPPSVRITTLEIKEDGVYMEGRTPSDQAVAEMVIRLRQTEVFSSVVVNSIFREMENSIERYAINCKIAGYKNDDFSKLRE